MSALYGPLAGGRDSHLWRGPHDRLVEPTPLVSSQRRGGHPNIAAVLDAGATTDGRPYFVMKWVDGMPMTRYCDDHQLNVRQRLELFIPVCLAVQHAHQKAILHRDLKPSNLLVMKVDGRPIPKVIDVCFGGR